MTPRNTLLLNKHWTFKQGGRDAHSSAFPANDLPTEIHLDLLKNDQIPNPFNNLNELSVRWIADETWTYQTTFESPEDHGEPNVKTVMKFEGLDTFASVYLNGNLLLTSENMFVWHEVDVSEHLKTAHELNEVQLVFESARQKGLDLVKQHHEHRFIVHQTEISRGPVRKAQYHWGWDWGPILLTCGPWKPITLETYVSRIRDISVKYELSDDLKSAHVRCKASVDGPGNVIFEISGPAIHGSLKASTVSAQKSLPGQQTFELNDVHLWWPRGYGDQSLYTVQACSVDENGKVLDRSSIRFGLRKAELVQEKDAHGQSFYFRINNIDIFAGGSCWVPADSFASQISLQRYRDWVQLAAEGNQIMIRIWGGGIYEPDAFYDACDEFGVLVWQDFMFACANYPAYLEYLDSVRIEAVQNLRRLHNHPSIVIWAGNNEDYQIVERYGLEYDFEGDKDPQSWLKTNFPARYIYEHLLPKLVSEETEGVPYHPSSPFGNGKSTVLKVDPTVGDIHQWNMWHGEMKPYQLLPEMGGRFVSEFGMEAYPHVETIEKCISREEDRYPGSMAMDFRNKAIGHERRVISYVAENFRIRYDLPNFTHLTQVMQADAMAWAYKSWRRQWGSPGDRKCGGALVWQLNDCWPTMSWAVVDYHLVPKPAYYAIKRAMQPIVVGVARKLQPWMMRPADELWQRDTSHIDLRKNWENVKFDVWASSNRPESVDGEFIIKFISVRTGRELHPSLKIPAKVKANSTTEVVRDRDAPYASLQDPKRPFEIAASDPFVIRAILNVRGQQVASDVSWPDPIKYLDFADRELSVDVSEGSKIMVTAERPVKGFVIGERQGVKLTDNGLDVMPGEKLSIKVEGAAANNLEWRYIGM
ncbi:glycoside hydrolase [Polyplosphaeria fusca]|uniref:Beta-mannosidase B n=1 Tax=Polyplosphaeria fusca TaxID=682080 RepID=A0A9P4V111_9PLEO|nr:glycoside hydrolase [Polyplosphaeria fusca]